MRMVLGDILEWCMFHLFMPFFLVLAALMLIVGLTYTPYAAHTEAQCLERGYPKSAVTWNFKQYCMNLDGSVTVRVDALE